MQEGGVTTFIASWPIISIPGIFVLYVLFKLSKIVDPKKRLLMLCSVPGIVIAYCWFVEDGISVDPGYLIGTLIIAPTNIMAPIALLYAMFSPLLIHQRWADSRTAQIIDRFLAGLLVVLYVYEQLIILVAQQSAD
jgi:hypothetical protein